MYYNYPYTELQVKAFIKELLDGGEWQYDFDDGRYFFVRYYNNNNHIVDFYFRNSQFCLSNFFEKELKSRLGIYYQDNYNSMYEIFEEYFDIEIAIYNTSDTKRSR